MSKMMFSFIALSYWDDDTITILPIPHVESISRLFIASIIHCCRIKDAEELIKRTIICIRCLSSSPENKLITNRIFMEYVEKFYSGGPLEFSQISSIFLKIFKHTFPRIIWGEEIKK